MNKPLTDEELEQFEETRDPWEEALQGLRDVKAGRIGRITKISTSPLVSTRLKAGLSQAQFAILLGVSVRTLQDWEQGRRQPSGAARTLIAIAEKRPEVLREVLESTRAPSKSLPRTALTRHR